MFGSSVLDVAIGTTFVFLLVALGVTAANELLASLLRWRAKNLADGVREILDDRKGEGLKKQLYEHPLIKSLYRQRPGPSYIPGRLFAMALLDVIAPAEPGKPRSIEAVRKAIQAFEGAVRGPGEGGAEAPRSSSVQRVLIVLLERAEREVQQGEQVVVRLEQNVELWFNGAMDRVSGWYKRRMQVVCLVVAALFVAALNVDSIRVVRVLSRDAVMRSAISAQAAQAAKIAEAPSAPAPAAAGTPDAPRATAASYAALQTDVNRLTSLGIPIGWREELSEMELAQTPKSAGWALSKLCGLLLTTLAALLGAPFWFDVLNKVMSIRSAVKAPVDAVPVARELPSVTEPSTRPALLEVVTPLAPPADGPRAIDRIQ
jgi:hypothetical protein